MGKSWKNGGKGEIFTVLRGKNIILEKWGGGAKISIIWIIYTPGLSRVGCPKFGRF